MYQHLAYFGKLHMTFTKNQSEPLITHTWVRIQQSTLLLSDCVYNQEGTLNKIAHQIVDTVSGCGCLFDCSACSLYN